MVADLTHVLFYQVLNSAVVVFVNGIDNCGDSDDGTSDMRQRRTIVRMCLFSLDLESLKSVVSNWKLCMETVDFAGMILKEFFKALALSKT